MLAQLIGYLNFWCFGLAFVVSVLVHLYMFYCSVIHFEQVRLAVIFVYPTAATVWLVAAIGLLCGIGLTTFAIIATLLIVFLLGFLRSFDILKLFRKKGE
jgi:predicted exporter